MASCAFVLTLGKRHARYAPSTYKVCITPTQAKRLFGTDQAPKALDCGVFACVFAHKDSGKVVKITRDPSDVAGLMQAQGCAQVPKLFASHKLVGQPRWTTPRRRTAKWQQWPDQPEAFALVVERLRVLTGAEKAKWNQRILQMRQFQANEEQKRRALAAGGEKTVPVSPGTKARAYVRPTIGDMAKAVCPKSPRAEAESCRLRIRELNKISSDLRACGIDWSDIHAGNIGIGKNGRWKAIDLGASTTPLKQTPPLLRGPRER